MRTTALLPSRLRRALAGAAALAMLGVAAPVGVATAAPTDTPATLVASIESDPSPTVRAGESMTSIATVHNEDSVPLDDARVEMRVTSAPLGDLEALDAFLAGSRPRMSAVGAADVGISLTLPPAAGTPEDGEAEPETVHRLAPGGSATVSVTAAAADLPFAPDTWAVHGVEVVLVTAQETRVLLSGAVTWIDASMPRLELATLATATGISARVRAIAAASDIPGVTLAIDTTALSDLGKSTLDMADRDVMTIPAGDPDLVSLAHAGEETLLDFALSRVRGGSGPLTDLPWLAHVAHADSSTAGLAASKGASALLVTAEGDDAAVQAVQTVAVGDRILSVLTPDEVLSDSVSGIGSTRPGGVGAAVATGALTAAESDGPVLAWTGADWAPTGSESAIALSALMSAEFVDPISVPDLAEGAGPRTVLPTLVDEDGDLDAATITGLARRLSRLGDLSLTAQDPSAILEPGGRTLLSPLATSLRDQPQIRSLRVTQSTAAVDQTLGALTVAAGSDVNFIADSGSVPVTVRNDLDVDATVTVDMTSFAPNLQVRDAPTVTIPAGSSMAVPVEVEAVSSANVNATIVLRNPDGTAIGAPVSMSVRVRADWGTAMTAFFTAGLVLLLVMGVVRTVRRGRKETRTGPRPDPLEETGSEALP